MKMATAYVSLIGVNSLRKLARLTLRSIPKDNHAMAWIQDVKNALTKYIKKIRLFGVEIGLNMPRADLQGFVDNFASQMHGLLKRIGKARNGLLLVMDDIKGLAEHAEFAHWLKSVVDGVAASKRDEPPLFLIFAGLEERRRQLMKHNPSVGRIFQPTLSVEAWTNEETVAFFSAGFRRGGVELPRWQLDFCAGFSGGLPMVAQEIGHAIWTRARKMERTEKSVHEADFNSIVLPGIRDAAEEIGRKYPEASVFSALHSEKYRSILRKIARIPFSISGFTKRNLAEDIGLSTEEQKILDNFINRMLELKAILPDENGARGAYRFPTFLHHVYFILATEKYDTRKKEL